MIATKARKVTYLGVPAMRWEVRQNGPTGVRSVYTKWLADAKGQPVEHPAGTIVKRVITGPNNRAEVVVPEHVVTGADAMTPPSKQYTI